ncbi:MAG TPA: SDR family NAD(P)-dependent oxidoreductase [Jatrophihabitantaceae bacterium]
MRTVVVTGASAGVGRAVARAFGARHDRVALLVRGRSGLDAAADEIRRAARRPRRPAATPAPTEPVRLRHARVAASTGSGGHVSRPLTQSVGCNNVATNRLLYAGGCRGFP